MSRRPAEGLAAFGPTTVRWVDCGSVLLIDSLGAFPAESNPRAAIAGLTTPCRRPPPPPLPPAGRVPCRLQHTLVSARRTGRGDFDPNYVAFDDEEDWEEQVNTPAEGRHPVAAASCLVACNWRPGDPP
jgi:hypothetical protein